MQIDVSNMFSVKKKNASNLGSKCLGHALGFVLNWSDVRERSDMILIKKSPDCF